MNKLSILVKNYLLLFWGSIKYGKKTSKLAGSAVILAAVGIFLIFSMGTSAVGQISAYRAFGFPQIALYNGLMFAILLSLLMAVMRSGSSTTTSDADMLLSLPLTRETILLAKSVSKYLFELVPIAVFFLPSVVVYFVMMGEGIGFLLRGLGLFLLIPLLSVGVSYLLGWFFFKVGSKLRNPQIITTILTMIFLIGFLVFNFSLSADMGNTGSLTGISETLAALKPLAWGVDFILKGSLISLLLFFTITLLPFALGLILYARIFGMRQKTWHSTKTQVDYRQLSPKRALLAKELRRYFGSSIYLLNTGFGMVMAFLLTLALLIGSNTFLADIRILVSSGDTLPIILILIFSFCAGMCYTAACSISLEGKQLWILKVHPVSTQDIFIAKVLTNIIITLPLTFICTILASLILELSLSQAVAVVLLPCLVCVMSALLGLVINLNLPKLDWDDESKVVKQSMASMLAFFVGVLPIALPFVLYFIFLSEMISFAAISIITGAFIITLIVISLLWLNNKGIKTFKAL